MRLLHAFENEKDATRVADAFFAESIASSVRDGNDESFDLWVHDDEDLEAAQLILDAYLSDPKDARFDQLAKEAAKKRGALKKEAKKSRHKEVRAKEAFKQPGMGPVTIAVLAICAFVAVITQLGGDQEASMPFYFISLDPQAIDMGSRANWFVATMQRGEVWRLVLPVFLHLGFFHILFNLWWWKDLAAALERVNGTLWLFFFTLVIALAGNFAEFFFGAPLFGGLSGVVFGLFGYVWIRGRFDPRYPLGLPKTTVWWMMAWYVLCFTDIIPIANWAHTAGLVVGGLWGFFSSGALRRRFLRKTP